LDLKVWRISKPEHGKAAANGTGAHRWNSPGAPIIYAAQSRALAALELLGHLEGRELFQEYVLVEIGLGESLVHAIDMSSLPENWRADPPPVQLKRFGDDWIRRADRPVLRVPSALIPEECNCLLNTEHPEFRQLQFGEPVPFRFDSCLIKNAH
jgi:RES domain-containing protein